MLKNQCISVTDLRTKTKDCLKGLGKKPKYVFLNNRPIAVLVDIQEYEAQTESSLIELRSDEVTPVMLRAAARARRSKSEDLVHV